jgi:putative holliday junction resolvase
LRNAVEILTSPFQCSSVAAHRQLAVPPADFPRDILKQMTEPKEEARILAVDYGRARMGLAVADAQARLARPLGILARKNRNEDLRRLREIVREHGVKRIVIGLPLRLDGSKGEMAEEVERFAERVRKQIGLPVELVDERLTSWEAENLLEEKGGGRSGRAVNSGRKQKKESAKSVDALAAAVILREYLARAETAGKGA